MVRRALDLIRGQSEEVRPHIREFQRQIRAGIPTPSSGAAPGHYSAHEPGHGRLDPGEHVVVVVGSPRRGVRRPVSCAAAAFARIAPQLASAARRKATRRRREAAEDGGSASVSYGVIDTEQGVSKDGGGGGNSPGAAGSPPPRVMEAEKHRRLKDHVTHLWLHAVKKKEPSISELTA